MAKSPAKDSAGIIQKETCSPQRKLSLNDNNHDLDHVLLNGTGMKGPGQVDRTFGRRISSMSADSVKRSSFTILISTLPMLIAISVGWIFVPCFLKYQISNKVVISPEANPELYSAWIHPPVPVYLKVYLYNVTNPEDVRKGELPKLQELGPYVFRENRTKVDISHDDPTDTVTYKEYISYHFEEELSGNARMDDEVTIINVPFAAAALKIVELPWPLNDLGKTVLLKYKEPLFIKRTAEEALFKGWRVPFLDGIEEDVGISLIPNNTFAFFVGQNDTAQGPYTVSRGTNDKSSFGTILKFKNKTELDVWGHKDNFCNQLKGTDGTIFSPFISKSTTLRLFNAELCRSLYLTYNEDSVYDGMKAYRFTAPRSVLKDPRESEENRCFCETVDSEPQKCLKQGALDLGPCREGAPVALSTPHFLDGDMEYIQESGLTLDREKHDTFMDIEPLTGVILQASKKIQINLILKPVKGISALSKVPDMLFPLVWADECASLDQETTERFKSVLYQLWLVEFASKWGLLAAALIISLAFIIRSMHKQKSLALASPETLLDKKLQEIIPCEDYGTDVDEHEANGNAASQEQRISMLENEENQSHC